MQITLDIDNEQDLLLLLSITNRIGIKVWNIINKSSKREFKEVLLVILYSGKKQQELIVNYHSDKYVKFPPVHLKTSHDDSHIWIKALTTYGE